MNKYIYMIKVFKIKNLTKYFLYLFLIVCSIKFGITKINLNDLPYSQTIKSTSLENWKVAVVKKEFPNIEIEPVEIAEKSQEIKEQQEKVESMHPIENVTTEEVKNSVVPRFTNEYRGVKINNSTDYNLDENTLNPDNINFNKDKVIIYHTHTCESYTQTEKNKYESSGTFRSVDLNFSVAKVGDELENQFKSYGHEVIHDKTYHDYPAYNGSYSRSLKTVQEIINNNREADIVIDLHRDAIADESYAPKVKNGDEYVSQLMFVIGTDKVNKNHKDWSDNLKFAIKVQQKANELYPGLFKPIILRNSEYNQHIARAACIIEVGATGNTLEESELSMKYLAKVIESI